MNILQKLPRLPTEITCEILSHVDLWTLQSLARSSSEWRQFLLMLPEPWWTTKLNHATVGTWSHTDAAEALQFAYTGEDPQLVENGQLVEIKEVRETTSKRDFCFETLCTSEEEARGSNTDPVETFTKSVSRPWTDYMMVEDELLPVDMVRTYIGGRCEDELAEVWQDRSVTKVACKDGHVSVSRGSSRITIRHAQPLAVWQRSHKQTFLHDSDTFFYVDWVKGRILQLFKAQASEVGHLCIASGHVMFTHSDCLIVMEAQYPEMRQSLLSSSSQLSPLSPISSRCYRVHLPANLIDKQIQAHVSESGQKTLLLFSTPHIRAFVVDLTHKTIYKCDIGQIGCQSHVYGLSGNLLTVQAVDMF